MDATATPVLIVKEGIGVDIDSLNRKGINLSGRVIMALGAADMASNLMG